MARSVTVHFEDTGDWWETLEFLTVGLEREYTRIAMAAHSAVQTGDDSKFLELTGAVDSVVLKCTTDWSYGPIDLDTLHNLVPAHHYSQIVDALSVRYLPLVRKNIENSQSVYSSLSKPESQSPANSSLPTFQT